MGGSSLVWAVVGAVLVAIASAWFLRSKHDPREPPVIAPQIPVIGHVVGLIGQGFSYISHMSFKHRHLPAITLNLLGNKLYIVNTPPLVAAVQRNHRKISFDPFLTAASSRVAGIWGDDLLRVTETRKGGEGVNQKIMQVVHAMLLGPSLDSMNERMLKNMQARIDELALSGRDGATVDLWGWCRKAITAASTDAVYGPLNPFVDPELEQAFWDFENNISMLFIGVFPKLIARKAYIAREKMVKALIKYYKAKGHEDSSELTLERYNTHQRLGVSVETTARAETAQVLGILSNSVPATFWLLFDLGMRPQLLADIRDEIRQHALKVDASSGKHSVDLTAIKDECHLLVSVWQELLRYRSTSAGIRIVYEDLVLNDQYLVKEGSLLQIPAYTINREKGAWGTDADEFKPLRFAHGKQKDLKLSSFLSFGATPYICPGRHFATGEVLALTAMLVLRFDIEPVGGVWKEPKTNTKATTSTLPPPVEEFPVRIASREEFAGALWEFTVTRGEAKFGLITG